MMTSRLAGKVGCESKVLVEQKLYQLTHYSSSDVTSLIVLPRIRIVFVP